MVPLQAYINDETEQGSFVVHTRRESKTTTPSSRCLPLRRFHSLDSFFLSKMDSIQETSIGMTLTKPKLSSASLKHGMDVFGQSLDSIDVWSEEETFAAGRQSPRRSKSLSPRQPRRGVLPTYSIHSV